MEVNAQGLSPYALYVDEVRSPALRKPHEIFKCKLEQILFWETCTLFSPYALYVDAVRSPALRAPHETVFFSQR